MNKVFTKEDVGLKVNDGRNNLTITTVYKGPNYLVPVVKTTTSDSKTFWFYDEGKAAKGDEFPCLKVGHLVEEGETSELNFKDFLISEGVDINLFWENCRKRYQGFGSMSTPRKYLKTLHPEDWLYCAFNHRNSLERRNWESLCTKWYNLVRKAKRENASVVFGFKGDGDV